MKYEKISLRERRLMKKAFEQGQKNVFNYFSPDDIELLNFTQWFKKFKSENCKK